MVSLQEFLLAKIDCKNLNSIKGDINSTRREREREFKKHMYILCKKENNIRIEWQEIWKILSKEHSYDEAKKRTFLNMRDNFSSGKSSVQHYKALLFYFAQKGSGEDFNKIAKILIGKYFPNLDTDSQKTIPPNEIINPTENKTSSKEAHPLHNSHLRRLRRDINQRLEDYEPSGVEEDFSEFLTKSLASENDSAGLWLLTGGPGGGKSAIMASLANRYLDHDEINSFGYFFDSNSPDEKSNTTEAFYKSLFLWLSQTFNIPIETGGPPYTSSDGDRLSAILSALHQDGKISRENALVIIVDALDEIKHDNPDFVDLRNPLELVFGLLPPGVIIACSERVSEHYSSIHEEKKILPHNTSHLRLSDSDAHKRTAINYVKRKSAEFEYIRQYGSLIFETDWQAFVQKMCDDADYNFLILKCILNEETYWPNGNAVNKLPNNIMEYFGNYFHRMTKQSEGQLAIYAVIACSVQRKVAEENFLLMQCGTDEREKALFILDIWLRQGLLRRYEDEDHPYWIKVYHDMFREYLETRKDLIGNKKVFAALIPNLLPPDETKLDNHLTKIKIDHNAATMHDWIDILISFAALAGDALTLRRCLCDYHFWKKAAENPNGVHNILDQILYFDHKIMDPSLIHGFYTELSDCLKLWTAESSQTKPDGEKKYQSFVDHDLTSIRQYVDDRYSKTFGTGRTDFYDYLFRKNADE